MRWKFIVDKVEWDTWHVGITIRWRHHFLLGIGPLVFGLEKRYGSA